MKQNNDPTTLDPDLRRRCERLLSPVRLEDPYPAIPRENYIEAIVAASTRGRS
jgi:hypothetical protein